MNDVGERVQSVLHGEVELVVHGADVVGHDAGGGQVGGSLQPDAERMQAGPPRLGAVVILDPVSRKAPRHRGHDGGVQSSGQEHAVGHVGHELPVHGGLERLADA